MNNPMPISQKTLTRILVAVIVLLTFLAGYYESQAYVYQKRLKQVQANYETLKLQVEPGSRYRVN